MPVQHFAQPTASSDGINQTEASMAEIRWDFGYNNVEILEGGQAVARINNPELLIAEGIEISTNHGNRYVMHVKKNTANGPFQVFRNDIELVGGLPNWGTAPSVAGKMVHLATELFEEKEWVRTKVDRPVRAAQSWMGFLSFVALVYAYLSGLGSRFVPDRFLSSIETSVFSGAIAALVFMAMALATQRRTAFFVLPFAQIFTIVQGAAIGRVLLDKPKYPHLIAIRVVACALAVWVMIDSWNSARVWRRRLREHHHRDETARSQIEHDTVAALAVAVAERTDEQRWVGVVPQDVQDIHDNHGRADPTDNRYANEHTDYQRTEFQRTEYQEEAVDRPPQFASRSIPSISLKNAESGSKLTRLAEARFGSQVQRDESVGPVAQHEDPNTTEQAQRFESPHPISRRLRSGL